MHKIRFGFLGLLLCGLMLSLFTPAQAQPFSTTDIMNFARFGHTATRLPNGQVLITGGEDINFKYVQSAELYDPAGYDGTGSFLATGNMGAARAFHTATLLNNGKVLITGGYGSGSVNATAELYDPAGNNGAGSFTPTGSMSTPRQYHTATLLNNGKVLITGGYGSGSVNATAELYDPAGNNGAGSFTPTGSMSTPRQYHTATLLQNGEVLIAGGDDNNATILASAELYDPAGNNGAGSFTATGSMSAVRYFHTATLFKNGKVLIAGGLDAVSRSLASAELYDPTGNNGAGSFTATGSMITTRGQHTATLLQNGKVLVAGGLDNNNTPLASAALYDPAANNGVGSFTPTGSMSTARYAHTATLLSNGKVLVAGGKGANGVLDSAELFQQDILPGLVLQNNQQVAFFYTNGANVTGSSYALANGAPFTMSSTWQVVATGDFNSDGATDLVLQDSFTGQVAFWFTRGPNVIGTAYATNAGSGYFVPSGWQIVGAGDFNGDGKPDLVMENQGLQQVAVLYCNGTDITNGAYVMYNGQKVVLPTNCHILGVGDFNGDGKPDLAVANLSTGLLGFWLMNNNTLTSGVYERDTNGNMIAIPNGWEIQAVGDYNNDSNPDLVLENTNTGALAMWFFNGTTLTSGAYVYGGGGPAVAPPGYVVSGPR